MKYFKKLAGKRCYLSPISNEDVEIITKWLNDLEVLQYLNMANKNISLQSEKEILIKIIKGQNYAIIDNTKDVIIGICGIANIDHLHRTAGTGIFIGEKKYWNKGFGREALTLLFDYGFKFLNLKNIMLHVYPFNGRAINCYKKLGFKEIGRRRKALVRDRQEYDVIFMDLLAEEFYAK